MSNNLHTVKEDPKKRIKQRGEPHETWAYETDEPREHNPWLFPQVIGGYRADSIDGISQSISDINTTVVDEQVIEDRQEIMHEPVTEEVSVTSREDKETQTESEPVARVVIDDAPQELIVTTEEVFDRPESVSALQSMIPVSAETQTTPENIEPLRHHSEPSPAPQIETQNIREEIETQNIREEVFSEPLGENESPHDSVSETEYVTVSESEPTPEPIEQEVAQEVSVSESEYVTASESVSDSDEEAKTTPESIDTNPVEQTDTSKIRKLDKEGNLDYVIYYERKPLVKPVALLHGRVEGQVFLHESVKFEYGEFYGQIFLRIVDTNDSNTMKDAEAIKNSPDVIKISPIVSDATALIYGEKFGGYIIGSGSTVTVVGNLTIRSGEKLDNIKVMSGGSYLVEIVGGMIKFVIHENTTVLLDLHISGDSYRMDSDVRAKVDHETQTEVRETVDEETQTELSEKVDEETLPEKREKVDHETQTEVRETVDEETQTELSEKVGDETQPEKKEKVDHETQTEVRETVDEETQTELSEKVGDETQPEKKEKVDHETQTEVRETVDEETQTELSEKVGDETRPEKREKVDHETQTESSEKADDEYRIESRVRDMSTQTERRPSFVSTHVITYVLYYHYRSKSDRAVAVLSGQVLGQTNTGCEQATHLSIPQIEGILVMVLLDNYDPPAMKDSATVKHSNHIIKICPRDNGRACIYGQTGAGFIFGSESILVISGRLLIVENNTTRTLTPGRHLVELHSGLTKFIICANGLCILVHTSGQYKIDDRSYSGFDRRETIVDTRGISDDSPHESVSESESETVSESVTDSETEHRGKVDRSTQTEGRPSFISSSVISYIVYERQNSNQDTAVAVLMGQVLAQTSTDCEQAKQLKIPRTDGKIVLALCDNHDIQLMKHSVYVMHSNDILKICPIGEAKACVYGQTGAGFVFGSDSLLIVSGQLVVVENGTYRTLSPGRHLIEPYSGTTKFIICVSGGKTMCYLVHTNGEYKIDDESYLDAIKPPVRKTSARISDTIRESETIGSTKPFGDQISRVSTATQTDSIFPSLVPSQIVSYIFYYHHHSKPDKPVAVLLGQVFGQTSSECNESKHMNIPRIEGKLVPVLLESGDLHLMKDSAIVHHSDDLIKICPRDEAKACIYGQTGAGFVFTSDAILIISGRLLIAENNSTKTVSAGRHLVEPHSGVTKFIICANGLCILVHTTGVYKIDDH